MSDREEEDGETADCMCTSVKDGVLGIRNTGMVGDGGEGRGETVGEGGA